MISGSRCTRARHTNPCPWPKLYISGRCCHRGSRFGCSFGSLESYFHTCSTSRHPAWLPHPSRQYQGSRSQAGRSSQPLSAAFWRSLPAQCRRCRCSSSPGCRCPSCPSPAGNWRHMGSAGSRSRAAASLALSLQGQSDSAPGSAPESGRRCGTPWRGEEEAAAGQETLHFCPYPVQVATASYRREREEPHVERLRTLPPPLTRARSWWRCLHLI